ncbi:nucleotide kinase domain-containing protein [Hyphomonas atlantica]|uniref:nucleotide kinase domain-containing protein n=1 Tax=Hyphomonas atlantica TaxID=1280948 RepID=UPI0023F20319|nr:nucleotide kinase domain-containing protein [Hyphomonas atlantica]
MAYDQQNLFDDVDSQNSHDSEHYEPLSILVSGVELQTTPVFQAYWQFAAKRQQIFFRRLKGANNPELISDPILSAYRFTNSYRASDRVSQYLIRNVIWDRANDWSEEDHFFRVLLFKLFNRIDTWEAIEARFGAINWKSYSFDAYDDLLSQRQSTGKKNYSAAYIMPSAGSIFGHQSKHANHLRLLEWMIAERFPSRLQECQDMADGYELLLSAPSIGPFLAYQFATDLNYGPLTSFSEMEFVKAGPGALDGVSKCFVSNNGLSAEQVIWHMAENQDRYFERFGIDFPDLWGRPLQLIDCQNLFCEISKYARVAFPEIGGLSGRSRIKQKFKPSGRLTAPSYPPDWGLNDRIAESYH